MSLARSITLDGRALPVTLRRNARSQRLSLRVDPSGEGVIVVAPPHVSERIILDFVQDKSDWVSRQLSTQPEHVPFADGIPLPFLGDIHRIQHQPDARRGVWAEGGVIHVSGRAEHLSRRLTDWLKVRARQEIETRVQTHAAVLGVRPGRITLRDTRTRWGSCSHKGDLSFSWRLVLAPVDIVNYVAAHEVAHLSVFDHSPKFWAVVAHLVTDHEQARSWLKQKGSGLHRYG
ncbi:MAG: M48 family metallopeptidase [Rhodospirillum sp.]|nr:M48 family metallopeptidase [Rhodospirillum sp.]MCF8491666.1 M48 family metallopeptidase [Rhodospirillum sp.]MCF8503250.1 M48 family metallopeptidase [Rhodospirillum sp.]